MDIAKQAVEALEGADRRLRELVGEAATASEDALVVRLLETARSLAELGRGFQNGASHPPGATPEASDPGRNSVTPGLQPSLRDWTADGEPQGLPPRSGDNDRSPSRRRAPRKGDYPKFFRRGDWLVKIGWSRKAHKEYEHKAPRRVCDLLASSIVKKGGSGRMFTVEDLLPLKDPQDGSAELPGYQVYVALAWFKSAGLIKVHGRRGYSVRSPAQLAVSMAAAWASLQATGNSKLEPGK